MTVTAALPDLARPFRLSPAAVEAFRRDGHVRLQGVLDRDAVAACRPHIARAVYDGRGANGGVNLNLWTRDDAVRRFVLNPHLGRIAADLLGVDAVRLFRDEPYFKTPGGAGTPWHQDAYFLPLDADRILTLWIPLMDLEPRHAPMSYATGSHRAGALGFSGASDAEMERFETSMRERGFAIANYGRFAAGDVAVHAGWTLHSARTNRSAETREVLIIIYYADGARVAAVPRAPGVPSLDELLPGAVPGELAAGELTPVVYRREPS